MLCPDFGQYFMLKIKRFHRIDESQRFVGLLYKKAHNCT